MKRFEERVALVTGAGSGIGLAVARRLDREGAVVYGVDLQPPDGLENECFLADVSNESAVQEILGQIKARHGCLHMLVNSAGVLSHGPRSPLASQSLEQWEAVLRTNLTSVLLMSKHAFPLLSAAGQAAIVNISSDQSYKGKASAAPYGVSKAGLNALTKVAALEFAEAGIRVNAVAPGVTRTNLLEALGVAKEKADELFAEAEERLPMGVADPSDVAGLVAFLLSDDARRITGEVVVVDSGRSLI